MSRVLYKNFDLIDVKSSRVVPDSYFIVENDIFIEVGRVNELSDRINKCSFDVVEDLTGKTVMPGMFNIHIHCLSTPIGHPANLNHESAAKFGIRGMVHLQQHLKSGVTFVRDMNGRKLVEVELKQALKEGIFEGPDMYICRQCLCMTGGHGWNLGRECDGVDDVMKAAREQIRGGADFIKIMATGGIMADGEQPGQEQLTEAEIRAAVEAAHRAGKRTASHAQGTQGIKNALRAGIDSIEHGIMLDDEAIEMMLKNNTAYVPTLAAPYFIIKAGLEAGVPKFALDKAKACREHHLRSFEKAMEAGVKIGLGTDAGTPYALHSETYMELVLMVEAGMAPMEAICTATRNSAEIVGVDRIMGTIDKGKKANFLVLDTSPLSDISSLGDVRRVYKNGKLIYL